VRTTLFCSLDRGMGATLFTVWFLKFLIGSYRCLLHLEGTIAGSFHRYPRHWVLTTRKGNILDSHSFRVHTNTTHYFQHLVPVSCGQVLIV